MATEGIELALRECRSMEQALADLRESHKHTPTKALGRMIGQLEAEIALRNLRPERA